MISIHLPTQVHVWNVEPVRTFTPRCGRGRCWRARKIIGYSHYTIYIIGSGSGDEDVYII